MTVPQGFFLFAGTVLFVVSTVLFFAKKTSRFRAMSAFAVSLAMIFVAFRPHVIELLGEDSATLRLRLVVALLSFIVITITLETIRMSRMQERYAFLWLVTGVVLFVGAFSDGLAAFVSRITGMSYGATVMVVLFAFVVFLLFYMSVALSRSQERLAQVVRELALAEERLRRIEAACVSDTKPPADPP